MEFPKRKPNRLKQYDYSAPGAYFVTICTYKHQKLFGTIVGGDLFCSPSMQFSPIGAVANREIQAIESHYNHIIIDKYIVMPNHIHMIVQITARIHPCPTMAGDISNVVGKFKAAVTRQARKDDLCASDRKIWQCSFYDHIIRNRKDYDEIWKYIDNNPAKWKEDRFFVL